MSKKKRRTSNNRLLATLFVLGAGVVGLLGYYVYVNGDHRVPPEERRAEVHAPARSHPNPRPSASHHVPEQEATYYWYDAQHDWKAMSLQVRAGQQPIVQTVNAFLADTYPKESGIKLLSADVRDGHAVLNFTKGFAEAKGSLEESELINGVMRILGQFPEIQDADLMVDGEILETGHNVYDKVPVIR
jgi:hypothetical protein